MPFLSSSISFGLNKDGLTQDKDKRYPSCMGEKMRPYGLKVSLIGR